MRHLTFIGFFPKKKKTKIISLIKGTKHPVIFFESPHRITKTLKLLADELGEDRQVFVARELTKLHETLYRGNFSQVLQKLGNQSSIKGEITVVLGRKKTFSLTTNEL